MICVTGRGRLKPKVYLGLNPSVQAPQRDYVLVFDANYDIILIERTWTRLGAVINPKYLQSGG